MGEQDNFQITVLIGGRPYPLKIMSSNESVIRRVVRDINDKVNKYQLDYPNRDKQDCLAMTALAIALDFDLAKQDGARDPQLSEQLVQLDELLDRLLQ